SSANEVEKVTNYSKKIVEYFIKRTNEMNLSAQEIEDHANNLINEWNGAAQRSRLNYSSSNHKSASNLLYPLGDKPTGTFKTPNSMRDVEPNAKIYIGRDY